METAEFKRIPDIMKKHEQALHELKDRQDEIALQQKIIETTIMDIITEEVDEEGKKKYTNETKRKIELQKRLDADNNYKQFPDELRTIKEDIRIREIELSYLSRKLRVFESLSRLGLN